MKRNKILYVFVLLITGLLVSCEKDTEGISRTTFYPDFIINGSEIVTLVQGETYVDSGATASADGEDLDVTTTIVGSPYIVPGETDPSDVTYTDGLDTNVPGLYIVTYSAINKDGFAGTAERLVFVLDKPADPSVDLSGTYTSTAPSPAATITKVAEGVYFSTNVWGGGSTVVIPAYMISTDGVNVQVPQQESLVRIFGYGTRNPETGNLSLKMSRPTFNPPLIDVDKPWVKVE